MRVGIAADHGGSSLRDELATRLRGAGHEVVDFGAYAHNPDDDYPDFVIPLAEAVAGGWSAAWRCAAVVAVRRSAPTRSLTFDWTQGVPSCRPAPVREAAPQALPHAGR
jgi:hypothetical protein